MEFLGHIINDSGVQPGTSKVKSTRQWLLPTSVYDIQVFLGMAGYYSCFVPKYADKATDLTEFLNKNTKQEWTTVDQE